MFAMRRKARTMDHIVETVHKVRLSKAIKSQNQAQRILDEKSRLLRKAESRYTAAKKAVAQAASNVTKGKNEKVRIIKRADSRIRQREAARDKAQKVLDNAIIERTNAKNAVAELKAKLTAVQKLHAKALASVKKARGIYDEAVRKMKKQKKHALKWNIILKKNSKEWSDKQLYEIKNGGCANGHCEDFDASKYHPDKT